MASRRFHIRRDPYVAFAIVTDVVSGSNEEIDAEDIRAWFIQRGADPDAFESCLDYAWEYHDADFTILNYTEPVRGDRLAPLL